MPVTMLALPSTYTPTRLTKDMRLDKLPFAAGASSIEPKGRVRDFPALRGDHVEWQLLAKADPARPLGGARIRPLL